MVLVPCVCAITPLQKAWPIQVKDSGQSRSVNTVRESKMFHVKIP